MFLSAAWWQNHFVKLSMNCGDEEEEDKENT